MHEARLCVVNVMGECAAPRLAVLSDVGAWVASNCKQRLTKLSESLFPRI